MYTQNMSKDYFVFTAIGSDRVGLVDDISRVLESRQCNVQESRMAVLGGEFAVIMLVSAPDEAFQQLSKDLLVIGKELECAVNVKPTVPERKMNQGRPYVVHSYSVDAPGIIHAVTSVLHNFSINIEDLFTDTSAAPWTGTPMFHMKAHILIPESISLSEVKNALSELEHEKELDIDIKPYSIDWMEK